MSRYFKAFESCPFSFPRLWLLLAPSNALANLACHNRNPTEAIFSFSMHSTRPSLMKWWKQRRPSCGPRAAPALGPSNPESPRLETSALASTYHQGDIMEKAVIRVVLSDPVVPTNKPLKTQDPPPTGTGVSSLPSEPRELPPKCHTWTIRHLRLSILTVYRRIFTLIFVANLIGLVLLLRHPVQVEELGFYASLNLLVAILFRQDFMVNLIFRSAWVIPWSFPLRVRRMAARAYTYGGIHSGASVAGTMWFLAFTWMMTLKFASEGRYTLPALVVTWVILFLLVMICLLAFPDLRSRYHNTFEITHRFLGWISVTLFWIQINMLAQHAASRDQLSTGTIMWCDPTFWNLVSITLLLIIPWVRLRRWDFTPYVLSPHALRLQFTNRVHRFSCFSISTSPFGEYHPFATFPSTNFEEGSSSLIISAAGDWTKKQIARAQELREKAANSGTSEYTEAKMSFWIKGSPKAGVLSLSCIFSRVIIVTTGSGIGPSLSSLLDRPAKQVARLIWSTRSPLNTYGEAICNEVEQVDPDAIVIDTDRTGRPDLVQIAWNCYQGMGAEAVFVLSNEKVTRKVVYGLESRGVPTFGPIWDS